MKYTGNSKRIPRAILAFGVFARVLQIALIVGIVWVVHALLTH